MSLHLHESFDGFWFDKNGNGIKLCLLQPLDSIARYVQDAVFPLERRRSGSDLPTQSALCRKQLAHTDTLTKERSHRDEAPVPRHRPTPNALTFPSA